MPIRKSPGILPFLVALGFVFALGLSEPIRAEGTIRVAQAQEREPGSEPPRREAPEGEGAASAPTPTDSGVETIVVRGADSAVLKDLQIADSVASFSAADLVALGATNIADLAQFTPNLEIVTAGSTTPTFFIRGVGLNDFNANSTGSVAIYRDDVAVNAPALQLPTLFDVESVNILRGPQGTGIARNASAGAIKMYGRKPTGQFNGFLRGETGRFDHQDYEGAIEAPIYEDVLSGRFAFRWLARDGTMENRCADAPPFETRPVAFFASENSPIAHCRERVLSGTISDIPMGLPRWVNDKGEWAARGTLLFEPTLDTSFLLNAHGSRRDEFSRVGQSYGTQGFYCLNNDVSRCVGLNSSFPTGTQIAGLLGGEQGPGGLGYQPNEVRRRLTELAPCYGMGDFPTCGGGPANPNFAVLDRAKQIVARELARDLDDRPWEGDFNFIGKTKNDTWGGFWKGEIVGLPGDVELATVHAYDQYDRSIDLDLDFSPETLFHVFTKDEGWQDYHDAKLSGEAEFLRDSPVKWDLGGWILHEELDVAVENDLGDLTLLAVGKRRYGQSMTSAGGFGSFSFDFWDNFTLDGGVRYNWERKSINYLLTYGNNITNPLNEEDIWNEPTGTLRLSYHFRENTSAYWKYNHGWKAGTYNATGSPQTGITIAQPEVIDAFETGLHGEWFGGLFGADASLFYYRYSDYQIFTAQQYAGAGPEFVILNASDAEVYGSEINALVRPWAGMFMNVNFGWLETQFLDYVQIQQVLVTQGGSLTVINRELQNSGNPLLNSPRFKISVTAEQIIPLGRYGFLVPRYDGTWTDTTYYDAAKGRGIPSASQNYFYKPKYAIGQRPYFLHGARLAYRTPDGRIELAAWMRNIENKAYKTFGFDGSTFQNTTIYFVGDPRTIGGSLTVTF